MAREFNPKSFLNYFDFPSEEALIEKIIELDQDDAKYLEYLRQPYFHNNQPNEFFSHERLLNQFERIFTTPITPVSARRRSWQIGRWIPVSEEPAQWWLSERRRDGCLQCGEALRRRNKRFWME